MEQNAPIVAKKIFKILQVLYFMLRKSISKSNLLADLSLILKRGKVAGKAAIHSLGFHHHHASRRFRFHVDHRRHIAFPAYAKYYEFSCSNSPAHNGAAEDYLSVGAMEFMINRPASPTLPGFGASPAVRQLRITDSPFPLRDADEDRYVDEAAEEFIAKFYNDLRRQNYLGYYS